jgi:hypothetical protein
VAGASAAMPLASSREKGSRDTPSRAPDGFTLAVTRGSVASNTGSAMTASACGAGERPDTSRRITASTDADGSMTISCSAASGRGLADPVADSGSGLGSAANGTYSSAPPATIREPLRPPRVAQLIGHTAQEHPADHRRLTGEARVGGDTRLP